MVYTVHCQCSCLCWLIMADKSANKPDIPAPSKWECCGSVQHNQFRRSSQAHERQCIELYGCWCVDCYMMPEIFKNWNTFSFRKLLCNFKHARTFLSPWNGPSPNLYLPFPFAEWADTCERCMPSAFQKKKEIKMFENLFVKGKESDRNLTFYKRLAHALI